MSKIISIIGIILISVSAYADTHYVRPTCPGSASPYTNWSMAATNIQDAVESAGSSDTVLITNGTYYSTGTVLRTMGTFPYPIACMIGITENIHVRSVNGPAVTIVNGNYPVATNICVMAANKTGAIVDGFTITKGVGSSWGGGVFLWYGGTITNCWITGNSAINGGGAYLRTSSPRIVNCLVTNNYAASAGGGIYLYDASTLARNCLIAGNFANLYAGGVYNVGYIENCTIAGNTAGDLGYAGGVFLYSFTSAKMTNCIVYFNTCASYPNYKLGRGSETLSHCCTTPDPGTNGINCITADPQFMNYTNGDFRLKSTSPCIDAGTVDVPYTQDFHCRPHWDFNGDGTNEPDMGCFEFYVALPSVSPLSFTNTAMIGAADSMTNELKVWNPTNTFSMSYIVESSTNWLTLSATNGTSSGATNTIVLSSSFAALSAGVYTGTVSVIATGTYYTYGGYTTTQDVEVALKVNPTPCLVMNPASFSNAVMEGFNVTSQTIRVRNSSTNIDGGYYDMNYSVTSDVAWIEVNTNGTTSGSATSEVYIGYGASVTGFPPSETPYTGTVWVLASHTNDGSAVSNATQTVSVAVTVKAQPVISLSTSTLSQEVLKEENPTNQSFSIWNGSSSPLVPMSYTLSTNKSWLSLSAVSGTSTGEHDQVDVIFGDMTGFDEGTYTGRITVTGTDAGTGYLPVGAVTQTEHLAVTVSVKGPDTPTSVSASDGTYAYKIQVTWISVSNAASYEVWRNTNDNVECGTRIAEPTVTNYDDEDSAIIPGVNYYYWVRTKNSYGGVGSFSTPDTGWQGYFEQVVVSASDGAYLDKVLVSWTECAVATSYEVWRAGRAQDDVTKASLLGETANTTYNDTSAERGMLYYYWIRPRTSEHTFDYSDSDSGWRSWLPKTPETVSATDGTYTDKVRVTWIPGTNTVTNVVYRNMVNDSGSATELCMTAGTTYDDTTAVAVTTYYYWVRAKNDAGSISDFSTPDTGWRASEPEPEPEPPHPSDDPAPEAPAWISATDGAFADKVRVTWSFSTYATTYEVWRNMTNNTSSATLKGTATATGYDDTTVVLGSTYYYWVTAKNAQGKSGLSAGDSGFSALRPPADLGATDFCMLPEVMRVRASPGLVSVRVSNNGPNPMSETDAWALLEVYLSDDETFGDTDDISMGSVSIYMPMIAGQTTDVELTSSELAHLRIPSTVATGFYSVFLRVEHATFSDPDETNNVVERDGQIEVTSPQGMVRNDFDGDGKTDLTVYHEASGYWFILLSSTYSLSYSKFGEPGYEPVPGDFDGDGKTDLVVYHESSGYWFILFSSSSTLTYLKFGETGYMPVSGDFDGNWKTDLVVYHEVTGYWYILLSGSGSLLYQKFGEIGYEPVPGDFDGDGTTDLAVYHEASGYWFIQLSSSSALTYQKFGESGYTPVSGDFDGDGKTDLAVYHEATGYWFIQLSGSGSLSYQKLGEPGYAPVPGDFDGDGITDLAVYHESSGYWFIILSSSSALSYQKFGETGYSPVW